ncbi:MAG: TonB-dependent receptor domain-containing protein [Bryobacteraceae bacterium]
MMRRFKAMARCLVLAVAVLLAISMAASAQDYRGTVQGIVTDPTNAAVAGATVKLTNQGTGVSMQRQTDASGHYLFDFVIPGTYELTVEAPGFARFVRSNIVVLTRGDVTVDATLALEGMTQKVEVSEAASGIEFNTASMITTVQGNMLRDIPVLARNPFTLALLNPAVVNQYWDVAHRNPFYMWSSGGLDVGGSTGGKNSQELDGVSLNISARGSYNAPMDAVQEVAVQQNAVDAEFGFSAGGVLSLSMKSGTNEIHGTAYYFGRNPSLNAMTNRITQEPSVVRNHIWGGTVGHPIQKNKIFNFFTYERWKSTQPASNVSTVPTDLERTGDFSRSLRPDGSLRPIYDPFSTQFDPLTSTVTRLPFPGNVIPKIRLDPTGVKAINDLWKPNRPGDDLSGINNFKTSYAWWLKYWNLSDRVDYNFSDRLRFYARFSKYETRLDNPNWGGTIAVPSDNGGLMDALNAAADVLYMITPATTVDIRYGATYVEDDYDSQWAKVPESVWANLFPTGWYKPVLANVPGIYYPRFNYVGNGSAVTGFGSWWLVRGRSHNPTINVTHNRGIHHMKAGWQLRYSYDRNGLPATADFTFNSVDTGESFQAHDPSQSGNQFASALLGVVNSGNAYINPMFNTHQQQWAFYFQDDIKLTRNITINAGLRWEYETAPSEEKYMLTRYLDLTQPIPELQSNPPAIPSQVTSVAKIPYQYNGAFIFTDPSHPRMYDAEKKLFLPRIGLALRINDRTAFRTGYARYAVPMLTIHAEGFSLPKYGYSQTTSVLEPQQGKPRTLISDPFPASNPLRLPPGNSLGRYTNLGDGMSWYAPNTKTPINDRINFSLQRQLPWGIATDTTFFINIGHNVQDASMWGGDYSRQVNMMDPTLAYKYKGAVDESVPNPFYNLLPPNKMPGQLRVQPTLLVRDLLKPYPQYGDLSISAAPGRKDRYYALQFKAERPMANGLTFLVGYNYNRETHSEFFDEVDQYNYTFRMLDRGNPRHNLRVAGTWELPFGRGRKYMANANRIVDAILGGWSTSHILMYNSGRLLRFGPAEVTGDPRQNVPQGYAFNPNVFSVLPPYTPRTNPWYYDGLRGPSFWQLDSTLVKMFPITERVKFELRMEFYNLPNHFIPSDPDTSIGSATLGRSTWVAGGNYGREIQYTGRIRF